MNDAAAALGLRAGMPLADARAMYPAIAVADADERADCALLEAIADWCDRYTPLVGLDPPDGLDCSTSPAARICSAARRRWRAIWCGGSARAACRRASRSPATVGCAWGVARFIGKDAVERGSSLRATSETPSPPSPSRRLRLDADTVAALAQVGLKRIADVLDRPRAPLAARFGATFVRRIDQALGLEDEPITPRLPRSGRAGRAALSRTDRARARRARHDRAARRAARASCWSGAAKARGCCRPRCSAPTARCSASRPAPAEPLRDPARVARLFADRLDVIGDEFDPGFGFDMVRLCALVTERSDPQQTGLAAPDHAADLAHLIDRLGARFGLRRVTRQMPQDTHIPEFAVTAVAAHMPRFRSFPRSAEWSATDTGIPAFAGTSGN